MSRYLKSIVAVVIAGLTTLQAAISDSNITQNEWVLIALSVVGAIGVYAVPNTPSTSAPTGHHL